MALTDDISYFERFTVGDRYVHPRGRTVTEFDNTLLTLLVQNTAQLHFNQDLMDRDPGVFEGRRVVYGGIVLAIVIGLASEETGENAIADLRYDRGRHSAPVFHGDTLYAESQVLDVRPADRSDAGIVRFKHWGKNQRGDVVVEIEREVLVRRRNLRSDIEKMTD